jgi:hypothetical protein
MRTKVESYMVEKPDFRTPGEYVKTSIDELKEKAGMLLTGVFGNYYELNTKGVVIPIGRGVKRYGNGNYCVTESVYRKLSGKYNIMTDF